MTTVEVTVPSTLDGVRVDKAVALVADVSRSAVNAMIARRCITVDGAPVTSRSSVLREGQLLRLEVEGEPEPRPAEADPSVPVVVVYEDDDVIVVDKPAGLVVHPGAGHRTGTLVNGLMARYPELAAVGDLVGADPERPGIVHRLDRGTSGLMVVARSPDAYRSLVAQLGDRRVTRRYRALVIGRVEGESGVVDAPIGRSVGSPTRMAVSRRGKEARTRYRVERRFEDPIPTTLLTATLETGRTHQIRVHLSAIGHPVVADDTYARGRTLPGAVIDRPFLHAYSLGFDHPRTGEPMGWDAPLAEDLRAQLDALEAAAR